MLKPDDAKAQLETFKSSWHEKARHSRLMKLPKAAAAVGLGLFQLLPNGTRPKEWFEGCNLRTRSARRLGRDSKLRSKVLAAIYPTYWREIERGCEILLRLPYPTGYNRRPFRAPERPELYAAKIGALIVSINDALADVADDALTPEWVAAWAVHLHYDPTGLGYVFAGQIDAGRDDILEILKDSAANRHPIGGPGAHAIRGLLCCERQEAWQFVANLLLAAQRQEGLRQSILEAADEAHPQAFPTLLGIVLDQNLIRFAAAARAAGVWLGDHLVVEDAKALKSALSTVREYFDKPASITKALKNGEAKELHGALWALAFHDVSKAVTAAKPILKDKSVGRRIAAVKFLGETKLAETGPLVLPLLDDPDPRMLSAVLSFFTDFRATVRGIDEDDEPETANTAHPPKLFEKLEKLLPSLPEKPQAVPSPVTTWPMTPLAQETAADILVDCLQTRPAERLLPWLTHMSAVKRVQSLAKLCAPRTLSSKVRETLLACAAETNTNVREAALKYLARCKLAEDEAETLERLLRRKPPDLRRSVFELLLNRADKLVAQSIERLLAGDPLERAGGVELARQMTEAERAAPRVRELLEVLLEAKGAKLPEAEREAIDRILNPAALPPTLADGLGLFDPEERSPVVPPRQLDVELNSPAAVAFLNELDALVAENRDRVIVRNNYLGRPTEFVLGSVQYLWEFPKPDAEKSLEQNLENLPLKELWLDWFAKRPASTRDSDGLELLRAAFIWTKDEVGEGWPEDVLTGVAAKAFQQLYPHSPVALRFPVMVKSLLNWFLLIKFPKKGIDSALDAFEHSLAMVPAELLDSLTHTPEENDGAVSLVAPPDWREGREFTCGQFEFGWLQRLKQWTDEHSARYYRLLRWLEAPIPGVSPKRPELEDLLRGYAAGAATLADFYDHVIGEREQTKYSYLRSGDFDSLSGLTTNRQNWRCKDVAWEIYQQRPELVEAVQRIVARIVEIEIERGETPTAASAAVSAVQSIEGMQSVFQLIAALGKANFKTGYWNAGQNKPESLTSLIRVVTPTKADTPEKFAAELEPWLQSGKISHDKVVSLGLLNTEFVKHVAHAINWPGYEEACYWFMAHSVGTHAWTLQNSNTEHDDEKTKSWRAIVKARSALTAEQRADGVIDVDWFHKAYAALSSDERWDAIEKAARFLGYGHAEKRAARLADVLLGRTKKADLVDNIERKFLKESVRLLGLLPLPTDAKKREAELADRYRVLKSYERYARGLSSLSKEPALQSYRLGMQNLAVTAGFTDPVRLEWAVTGKEVADLADGPDVVQTKEATVSLRLGEFAEPEVVATRNGKELKSLSKELRANPRVAELLERKKDIARLVSSTKRTLELAMCAGDRFEPEELKSLLAHALVRPMLERLVLKTTAGLGYPAAGGAALVQPGGKKISVKGSWSIAHPLDFVAVGNWHEFQVDCFRRERIQPFKQVFREVYTLSPAEKEDIDKSRRYSGQQVNENQAKALLSGRGWSTKEDLGKLYRKEEILVELSLDHGYSTPGDAAAPAVGEVRFFKRGNWKPIALADVPSVIFSEVMRDMDLVVSVAHVGGVDPEATQSTVEMRSSLLAETCTLLKLGNVKLDSKHALIQGEYAHYSVHLGSGVVHKQPGGSLCVVAVNAQHRGRLFLPFADDDPRTAEIMSKVLLLARDKEIQDPTILQQIVM